MADLSVNKGGLPTKRDSRNILATLVRCGIAVGVSDFLFASVANWILLHRTPIRVFQGVASVPFGKGMIDGGLSTAALGLALHFCVAFFWSAVYLMATRGSPVLGRLVRTPAGALAFAAVYGPLIWLTMTLVVIPAFVHRPPTFTAIWWVNLVGHIPFIVLPMVWAAGDGREKRGGY
jgi:hypothetical protein